MKPNQDSGHSHRSDELQMLVLGQLKTRVRSFKIDISEGGIVLNGHCDSFQAKQMAQEIIRRNTSLPIVTNNLVVDYSNAIKPPPIPSGDSSHASAPTTTQKAMMNQQRQFSKIFFPSDFSSDSEVAEARTVAVNVFILGSIGYLLNCRSLTQSVASIGWLSNMWLPIGVLAMLLFQLAFNYIPFMNRVFHSKPVDSLSLAAAAAVGVAIYSIVGFEKWIRFGRLHRK